MHFKCMKIINSVMSVHWMDLDRVDKYSEVYRLHSEVQFQLVSEVLVETTGFIQVHWHIMVVKAANLVI